MRLVSSDGIEHLMCSVFPNPAPDWDIHNFHLFDYSNYSKYFYYSNYFHLIIILETKLK